MPRCISNCSGVACLNDGPLNIPQRNTQHERSRALFHNFHRTISPILTRLFPSLETLERSFRFHNTHIQDTMSRFFRSVSNFITSHLHNDDGHDLSPPASETQSSAPHVDKPESKKTTPTHRTSVSMDHVSNSPETRHPHTTNIHTADMQDQITALEEEEIYLGTSGLGIRLSERLSTNIDSPGNDHEVTSYRNETLAALEGTDDEHDDVLPPYELDLPPPSYQRNSPGASLVGTRKLHGHPDRRGMMLSAAVSSDQSYSTPRSTTSPSTVVVPSFNSLRTGKSLGHSDRCGIADFSHFRFSFDDIPGSE